jgi:hypothetical protein
MLPTATATPTASGCAAPYLHTSGSQIVNACGTPVRFYPTRNGSRGRGRRCRV